MKQLNILNKLTNQNPTFAWAYYTGSLATLDSYQSHVNTLFFPRDKALKLALVLSKSFAIKPTFGQEQKVNQVL